MLLILRLLLSPTITMAVFYSKCNWAQHYNISELLFDQTLQKEIMSLASIWGGKFAVDGVGIFEKWGLTYKQIPIDFETGLPSNVSRKRRASPNSNKIKT